MALGIVASNYTITFKSDEGEDFTTQASLGCLRNGHPSDTLDLYRQATTKLQLAIDSGDAVDGTQYQSVVFQPPFGEASEYTTEELAEWQGQEQDGWICGTPTSGNNGPSM